MRAHKDSISPRHLAEALGVSESSIKRWVDAGRVEARRTNGGHRRIPRIEAIRFLRESRTPIAKPEILGLPDPTAFLNGAKTDDDRAERLFELLKAGLVREVRDFVASLYITGEPVADIADGPIRGAMKRFGDIWQHTQTGLFYEHRATEICSQAISHLRSIIPVPPDAPIALGGAPAGDQYMLPTMCAAACLADVGFASENLGPDSPVAAFEEAVADRQPALLWVSSSVRPSTDRGRRAMANFLASVAGLGVPLYAGGRGVDALNGDLPKEVATGPSLAALAEYATKIGRASAKPA